MGGNVEPEQTPRSVASDLDLHCLNRLFFTIFMGNAVSPVGRYLYKNTAQRTRNVKTT